MAAIRGGRLRTMLSRSVDALVRYGMVHLLSRHMPLFVVNEYPRSGGTWIGQMLSLALGVPFPRNRRPALASCVMHGHYLRRWGMRNVVVVWRDGRDVMVSWYYFCLFSNELGNDRMVAKVRKELGAADPADIRRNMPLFIEYAFERQSYPRFSWGRFVDRWLDVPGVVYAHYERLIDDGVREIQRIVYQLTGGALEASRARDIVEACSFARQAGRGRGEERSDRFLRKGVVGDWRTHFSRAAAERFDEHAGTQLMRLGYAADRRWVAECAD
jgi:hypothetical protein